MPTTGRGIDYNNIILYSLVGHEDRLTACTKQNSYLKRFVEIELRTILSWSL